MTRWPPLPTFESVIRGEMSTAEWHRFTDYVNVLYAAGTAPRYDGAQEYLPLDILWSMSRYIAGLSDFWGSVR